MRVQAKTKNRNWPTVKWCIITNSFFNGPHNHYCLHLDVAQPQETKDFEVLERILKSVFGVHTYTESEDPNLKLGINNLVSS